MRGISFVKTAPIVSIPSDSGVTSSSKMSFTSPPKIPPCIAAPTATASSGFTPFEPSLPKISFTVCITLGIRVDPPTKSTSSIFDASIPASANALRQGSLVRSSKSSVICSNFARVNVFCKCLGPDASAVIKGRLISVDDCDESSIFAFSAASRKRCKAMRSFDKSMPVSALNSSVSQLIILRSKSSPPKWVSPFVDFTSNTPSPNSSMEISKVPPPKS